MPQTKSFLQLNWRYLLRMLGLFLVFGFIFLFFNTTDDFSAPATFGIATALVLLVAIVWVFRGQRARLPLSLPLLVYCGVYLLTAVTSIDPRRSLGEIIFLLFAVFLFAWMMQLRQWGWSAELISGAMLLAGGVVVLFLWGEFLQWYLNWLQTSGGRLIPTITYRLPIANVLAFFFNPLLMIALARLVRAKTRFARVGYGFYALAVAGLSFLASSRAAWLGAGVGVLLLVFLAVRADKELWLARWRRLLQNRLLLAGLGILVLAALVIGGMILYRQAIHPTHGAIGQARTEYWPPAWETFLQHPITGQGPFTFITTWVSTYSIPPRGLFPHAHSTLLNVLAEQGVLGLAAMLWLLVAAYLSLWRQSKQVTDENLTTVWAGLAALAAFTIQGFFDCFHVETLGLWALLLLLGAATGKQPSVSVITKKARNWWALLVPATMIWNLVSLTPLYFGVQAANAGDWSSARGLLMEAVRYDPNSAIAQQQLGLAFSVLAEDGGDILWDGAIGALEQAVKLDPAWALNRLNLGALYLAAGRLDEAIGELNAAVKQADQCVVCWLNLGKAYEVGSMKRQAQDAYFQALALRPEDAAAYFWRENDFREQVVAAWLSQHPPKPPASIEELKKALSYDPGAAFPHIRLAEGYFALGEVDQAEAELNTADLLYFRREEERLRICWLRAEIAAARGDLPTATFWGEQAFAGMRFHGWYGPGMNANFVYAQIGFRRPAMAKEFTPQVQMIVLNDEWGERFVRLGTWYDTLNNPERAREIYREVLRFIPDLTNARQRLGE